MWERKPAHTSSLAVNRTTAPLPHGVPQIRLQPQQKDEMAATLVYKQLPHKAASMMLPTYSKFKISDCSEIPSYMDLLYSVQVRHVCIIPNFFG